MGGEWLWGGCCGCRCQETGLERVGKKIKRKKDRFGKRDCSGEYVYYRRYTRKQKKNLKAVFRRGE